MLPIQRHKRRPWVSRLPRDRDTVRLLVLEPALDPDTPIRCKMTSARISDKPIYEALSYTWGEPSPTRLVHIDMRPVEIRSNLHDCLLRLRDPRGNRILWIDAICINQNDGQEKSHQIELMPNIYFGARQVVAWLGESADGSDDFLTWANENQFEFSSSVPPPKSLLEPITRFFERQYWYRTWIIQELLKAQKQIFFCGGCYISAFRLFSIVERCTQGELREHLRILVTGFWENLPTALRATTFPELWQLSFNTHCTDDRDKIYALLGLLDKRDPVSVLKADYSMSTAELFQKVHSLTNPLTGDNLQPQILLKALSLRSSALKHNHEYQTDGTEMIWCNLILSTCFRALRKCTGVTWVKTKDVRVDDILIASPKSPNFYFALRQTQGPQYKEQWTCVGLTWASYHAFAGYCSDLKSIDCYLKGFYYSRVTLLCGGDVDIGPQLPCLSVPNNLADVMRLYVDIGSRLNHQQQESLWRKSMIFVSTAGFLKQRVPSSKYVVS